MKKVLVSETDFKIIKSLAFLTGLIEVFNYFYFIGKPHSLYILENGLMIAILAFGILFSIYFIQKKSLMWLCFIPFLLMPLLLLGGYLFMFVLLSLPIGLMFLVSVLLVIIRDFEKEIIRLPENSLFFCIISMLLLTVMRISHFYFISEFAMGIIGLLSIIFAYIALKKHFSTKIGNAFIAAMIAIVTVSLSLFLFFSSLSMVFVSDPMSVDELLEKKSDGDLVIEKYAVDHGAIASTSYYTRTSKRVFLIFEKVSYSNYRW